MHTQIVLSPDGNDPRKLRDLYSRAFREAQKLYVASAYLTDWPGTTSLGRCQRLVFVVGTDFGLTRKKALLAVLKWLPKNGSPVFTAVSGHARCLAQ
jgi:hypothetical protein